MRSEEDRYNTPLLRAVEKGDSYAVEKLLEYGARPTFDDELPLTPPQLAEHFRDEKIVDMLKPYTHRRGEPAAVAKEP
ncbi:hypothetical protein FOXB_14379 [Fusarium oxysporum f. sp. conglutinans Fo5176]|uniref:Uncharacterized protein n=1 Tax=Fusarium oxysporum (strain Fo5176) TaxID=660025 RepID=F9G6U7_FUSOF|nr:hypothetical protein FOXB_14379 [Fusarium oxysporum f. sp. conglutinans Fo5176]